MQIFEALHPIDLYHIILTTRELRALLLSKSASAIWESSFKAHPEILFYPAGVSAPKWALLLFGPDTCDVSLISLSHIASCSSICIARSAAGLTRCLTSFITRANVAKGAR